MRLHHLHQSFQKPGVCTRLTQRVVQVLLSHQLQVLLDGFGGQRVLPEDQDVVVGTSIHLRHHQVGQEVLNMRGKKKKKKKKRRLMFQRRKCNTESNMTLNTSVIIRPLLNKLDFNGIFHHSGSVLLIMEINSLCGSSLACFHPNTA